MNTHITTYYNQLAQKYDSDRFGNAYGRFLHAQERALLTRWLASVKAGAILDLGCGTGRFLDLATHGLDASTGMLEQPIMPSAFFENKVHNMQTAATRIQQVLLLPGQVFSFWHVVGYPGAQKGYKKWTQPGGRQDSGQLRRRLVSGVRTALLHSPGHGFGNSGTPCPFYRYLCRRRSFCPLRRR